MRLTLVLAVALALLAAGCTSSGPDAPGAGELMGGDDSSTRYFLNATLAPPVTNYGVVATFGFGAATSPLQSDGRTFTWTNSNGCGRFVPSGSSAVWHHGDDTDCDHRSPLHAGVITVVIGGLGNGTSSTGYATCAYEAGSDTGTGEFCTVSSVAPEGLEPARRSPVGLTPVLGGIALAAFAFLRRR